MHQTLSQRRVLKQAVRRNSKIDYCRDVAPEVVGSVLVFPIAVVIVVGILAVMCAIGAAP